MFAIVTGVVFSRHFSRHRIIPASAPRMAAEQTFQSKPGALQRAVFPQRLECILAACGRESARRRRQRRDEPLIYPNEQDEQPSQQVRGLTYRMQRFHGFFGVCFASFGTPSLSATARRKSKGRLCRDRQPKAEAALSAGDKPLEAVA